MSDVMTESSRLAAKTPTEDREVALEAWEAAQAEEAAYWKAINPEED